MAPRHSLTQAHTLSLSHCKFKEIVKLQTQVKAFEYLNDLKSKHKKISHIKHEDWQMADYLAPNEIDLSIEERKYLFQCRSRDLNVKLNKPWMYFESDKLCVCKNFEESQQHILECELLSNKNDLISYLPNYSDLFGDDLTEKVYIGRIMKENMRVRNLILENSEQ